MNLPALPLARAAGGAFDHAPGSFPGFCLGGAARLALLSFLVQFRRLGCAATLIRQVADDHLLFIPSLAYPQPVADADFAGDLYALAIQLNLAPFDG